jgi:hypothetical protein
MSHLIPNSRHERPGLRREEGQALVELALILPLLILLVIGVVDFGRALNIKNDETHLASEAARFAVVDSCTPCSPGLPTLNAAIVAQAESKTPPTIAFCYPNGTHAVGDPLHVTIRDTYTWLPIKLKAVGIDWNPPVSTQMTSNSEMRLETATNSNYTTGTWDSTSKTCS